MAYEYVELPGVHYELSGKIRSMPVSEADMRKIMAAVYATDPGLEIVVVSGGQAPKGSGGKRTGSTRHDVDEHGQAHTADIVLTRNGERLLPGSNKDIYSSFFENAAAVGFTGLGHYSWGVHVGGGKPAAWGPSKSSDTLDPDFAAAIERGRAAAAKGVGDTLIANYSQGVPTPKGSVPNVAPIPATRSGNALAAIDTAAPNFVRPEVVPAAFAPPTPTPRGPPPIPAPYRGGIEIPQSTRVADLYAGTGLQPPQQVAPIPADRLSRAPIPATRSASLPPMPADPYERVTARNNSPVPFPADAYQRVTARNNAATRPVAPIPAIPSYELGMQRSKLGDLVALTGANGTASPVPIQTVMGMEVPDVTGDARKRMAEYPDVPTMADPFAAPRPPVPMPPYGMISPGNVDVHNRPVRKNPDGSISTVRSESANFDGNEVLYPTIGPNGELLTSEQAQQLYLKTGQNLGTFRNPLAADNFAIRLHNGQAAEYGAPRAPTPMPPLNRGAAISGAPTPMPPLNRGGAPIPRPWMDMVNARIAGGGGTTPLPPWAPSGRTAPTPAPAPYRINGNVYGIGNVYNGMEGTLWQATPKGFAKVYDPRTIGSGNNIVGGMINRQAQAAQNKLNGRPVASPLAMTLSGSGSSANPASSDWSWSMNNGRVTNHRGND